MKTENNSLLLLGAFLFILYTLNADRSSRAADWHGKTDNPAIQVAQEPENLEINRKILVELFLAKERKGDLEAIK